MKPLLCILVILIALSCNSNLHQNSGNNDLERIQDISKDSTIS